MGDEHTFDCWVVTPLAGVWIEIEGCEWFALSHIVTPLAGVWIEIIILIPPFLHISSHSPCGSVD